MSLWVRLFLTFFVCLLLTLVFLGTFFAISFRDYYESELSERMLFQAKVIEPQVRNFLIEMAPQYKGYDELLSEMTSKQSGLGVTVLDPGGNVLFSTWETKGANWSTNPEIQAVFNREQGRDIREVMGEVSSVVAIPIVSNQEIKGILTLSYPVSNISYRLGQLIRFILATFIIALLVGSLLVYGFVRYQTQPLVSLIDSAQRISQGDLETTFESRSTDEVGQLGRVLQIMVGRLKSAIKVAGEERSRFQAIFSNMVDGIILSDSQSNLLLANPSALMMFGVSMEQVDGKTILDAGLPKEFVEIMLSGEAGVDTEIVITKPTTRILRIRMAPIEQEGKLIGNLAICEDVTRMKALEASEQEFIQYISHELKTPLASLSASVETLQTSAKKDPGAQKRFLSNIGQDVERLTKLVNSILAFQRVRDIGETMSKFGAVDMIMDVHSRFLAYANKRKVHLDMELPDDEVYVMANKERIVQVLINLIDNAIRFTQEDGKVTIGIIAEQNSKRVLFYVEDTGVGIPKEYLGRIGERFIKIPRKDHRYDTQVGLGVSIVKEILKRHGSPLEVESLEGKGTKFAFYLRRAS